MKRIFKLLFGAISFFVWMSGVQVFADNNSPLTQEEQTIFSQNNIVFYEPCTGEGSNEDVGVLEGKDNKERVWNWFAKAGIKGVSDNPVVIAGIMGNIEQESGYNPFASNGTYYGLYQEDAASMRNYVEEKCGPVQWGSSTDDAEKNSKAIAAELEWLQDHDDFKQFTKDLDAPNDKKGEAGAKAYAELFLVRYERAINGSDSIEDSGVYKYMQKMYGGTVYQYQQAKNRRDYAAEVYKYAGGNSVGLTAGSKGATSSDKNSGVHEKAWELADQTRDASFKAPTDAYLKAQSDVKCPGDCVNNGQSCDRYVATVVKSAGVDENIPWGPVNEIEDYMIKHSEIYTLVEGDAWDESTYQPGDIRVRLDLNNGPNWRGHIEIYGQRDGKSYILSASNGDRWAGYQNFFAEDKGSHEYHIYRTAGAQPKCDTSANGECTKGTMDINKTAVCLAYSYGTEESKYKMTSTTGASGSACYKKRNSTGCTWEAGEPTEAWQAAFEQVLKKDEWPRTDKGCPGHGFSCDVGTAIAVRYSGVDPKFAMGLDGMYDYAKKHSDIWDVIDYDKSKLKPGDIVLHLKGGHHVWTYVEDEKGVGYAVEAGLCSSAYHVSVKDIKEKGKGGNWILRAKNAKNTTAGVDVKKGASNSSNDAGSDSDLGNSGNSGGLTSGNIGPAQGKKDINAAAIELAWPADASKSSSSYPGGDWSKTGKKAAKAFVKETGARLSKNGADCGNFVDVVLWYAGIKLKTDSATPGPGSLYKLMKEDTENWEEVDAKDKKDLKPGDIGIKFNSLDLCAPYKGGCKQHVGIYVEEDGKGYTAQASHGDNYGRLDDYVHSMFLKEHTMRYKGSTESTDDACDRCSSSEDDAGGTGLKEGGMTLEEARAWMKNYYNEASKKKRGSYTFDHGYIYDAGCGGGTLNNCVAFSQWFLNKHTSIGPKWTNTVNGDHMVSHLGATKGLKTGKNPRPYAIFSTHTYNHTGVVMGVTNDKHVIVCEATCSGGFVKSSNPDTEWPGCRSWSLATTKSKAMDYAYTDDIMKPSAFGGGD